MAAVGMSEAAMAQTPEKIKIGVLSASLPIFEEGPNLAMELARMPGMRNPRLTSTQSWS